MTNQSRRPSRIEAIARTAETTYRRAKPTLRGVYALASFAMWILRFRELLP